MTAKQSRFSPVEQVATKILTVDPQNPRTITPQRMEQLKQSLMHDPDFLGARPLIALRDGTVIAGNHRLLAARELGWESLPVSWADLSEQDAKLIRLRDNNPYAEWDEAELAQILEGLRMDGADLGLTGFGEREIDRLLAGIDPSEGQTDPDDAPPLPREPKSRLGEVYELGEHRLLCGDATDPGCWQQLLGNKQARLIVTDPPYGVAYQANMSQSEARARHRRTDGKVVSGDESPVDTARILRDALPLFRAALDAGGGFYVWAPACDMETVFRNALADAGLPLHQEIVWVKDHAVYGRSDYHWRHETILYGWRKGAHFFVDDRTQDTVWECKRPSRSPDHPTQKPSELYERAIANSSRPGDIIVDPFAGSGTCIVACQALRRTAMLMEISPAYCDVIRLRWARFVGDAEMIQELPDDQ